MCKRFGPRARFTIALYLKVLIVVLSARKLASSRGWYQGVRWCDDIVEVLDSQSVSDEHMVEMASKERIILLHLLNAQRSTLPTPRILRKCWALCWREAGNWLPFQGTFALSLSA